MTLAWLAAITCLALLAFLLFQRAPVRDPQALTRLALLHGVQRIRGESEQSLRNRTIAAGRWPYSRPEPQFVWWARAWRRMIRALHRR